MACDICLRDVHTKDLAFLCPVDARNQLYAPRLALAHLLLDGDTLKAQVTDISPLPSERTTTVQDDTTRILASAEKLRSDIQAAREEIRQRRAALERKREQLGEVREKVVGERRRQKVRDEVERKTSVRRLQWAQAAEEMARHRAFLCNEAARLYGVKKGKGSGGKYVYYLARLPVVELTNMNTLTPEVISTSLAHICHILVIATHYLAIRLPAEIILPHRDHPRPAIFNLASSWQPRSTTKSRSGTSSRSPSGISLSGAGQSPSQLGGGDISRPRPLFIDKPLTQLAKEDSAGYAFFLEGVTLLAYNVAWLCCTQGVSIGDKTNFEDVCQMGRNLYNLLISRQSLPTPQPAPATTTTGPDTQKQQQSGPDATSALGRYSHGSTYYSLISAEGTELIRGFKLPSPMKLVDKLRRKLMGDAPDWEVLDDDAWRIEGEEGNGPSAHKNGRDGGKGDTRTEYQGWMRVKSR
ncbi:hypothetical protein NLU13_8053 [Sarocladium strictum]|uniref:Autophagy-related protein 14 n=1 Tax=Sarocladium strictum TaxID=5046 RepID=A0AA39GCC8_SARSR|nr:hypothetical protein NLU13_8053 [Sarocladium strictum]